MQIVEMQMWTETTEEKRRYETSPPQILGEVVLQTYVRIV